MKTPARSRSPSSPKRKNAGAPRDAEATRARILGAAKIHFSQNSFDGVGVRDIAADALVDPALVIRYFGSKEGLFREVAAQAFGTENFLDDGLAAMPDSIADLLLGDICEDVWRVGYNPFRLLLCSIGSPSAGPILSEYLDRDFILPLTAALPGEHTRERGAAMAAQILGFALIRVVLAGLEGNSPRLGTLRPILVDTLHAAIASG